MKKQKILEECVKLSQNYILLFLKDYVSEEKINAIKKLFIDCPVILDNIQKTKNEFGKRECIAGLADKDKITIDSSMVPLAMNNEYEVNSLLYAIIHEYGHRIIMMNYAYENMLEESFVDIFAETCINNAILKFGNQDNKELFNAVLSSIEYRKAESQIKALLYILKQNGADFEIIAYYVAGDREKFKQICVQIFGENFSEYYDLMSSIDNKGSEKVLIDLINKYIKENGLNISYYLRNNKSKLKNNNLYLDFSSTLTKAVASVKKENFSEEEQNDYETFCDLAKFAIEEDEFIEQEKIDRIKEYIENKFSLKNKSLEEIYDTIIDLCSTYIQHKNINNEESKLFIAMINEKIPYIEDFQSKFRLLRVQRIDSKIFDNLDINNITFSNIYNNINDIIQKMSQEKL